MLFHLLKTKYEILSVTALDLHAVSDPDIGK